MSRYIFRMPDLGEGTVEAEIVACMVKPGDIVQEEQIILEVMTEKAAVEIPSPVAGRIISIAGKPGQSIPVGGEVIVFETDASAAAVAEQPDAPTIAVPQVQPAKPVPDNKESVSRGRIMASPATRRRAKEAGIDLAQVNGSGPGGRIARGDLDGFISSKNSATAGPNQNRALTPITAGPEEIEEVPIIGMRRVIAQRMTEAVRTIPHFSYVEEVDVTQLEALRQHLNGKRSGQPGLTYLPLIALALARILPQFPQCNARYDATRDVLMRHRSLHLGIATQTPTGLKVPVIRHVERQTLNDVANEIRRVTEAARNNKAKREELSGSTLTLTSLGKLGGIASTPIINAPEVCIIGVNKAVERPMVERGVVVIRRMMNLSTSCDHRFVDGHDAASMMQALKEHLEQPALIFAPW
jgi:2-oxoisovalerate dehydrogenase E2 component (dihydrolipoyl transacylase)